jgi:hypothetical protein
MAKLGVAAVDKVPEDNTVDDLRARIFAKRQARMARALAREQMLALRSLAGLPPRAEDLEDAEDASNSSGSEQMMLDPYCVFTWYLGSEHGKWKRNGKKRKRKGKKGQVKGNAVSELPMTSMF